MVATTTYSTVPISIHRQAVRRMSWREVGSRCAVYGVHTRRL